MDQHTVTLHGTSLLVGERGVLLTGPPGSGKSSLALRLIDSPGFGAGRTLLRSRLVADDQTVVTRVGNTLRMTPPVALAGKLEIRGVGIAGIAFLPAAELALVVKLLPHADIERLPDERSMQILGVNIPFVEIDATSASATARLRAVLSGFPGLFPELRQNAVGGYVGDGTTESHETDSNA